ncbi:hypothetical protein DCO58_10825 [Helicobacter saguini]|nr:hypothetical protein [Helicobacter saguini]
MALACIAAPIIKDKLFYNIRGGYKYGGGDRVLKPAEYRNIPVACTPGANANSNQDSCNATSPQYMPRHINPYAVFASTDWQAHINNLGMSADALATI